MKKLKGCDNVKKVLPCILVIMMIFSGCAEKNDNTDNADSETDGISIELSDDGVTVDGEKASSDNTKAVYTANDIVFYQSGKDFTYGEGTEDDAHEQAEADKHTVVHIKEAGRYVLSGSLSYGQIAVDLGEEAETAPDAVVTLVFNNADITCTVAPAVIFYNVFECSSSDADSAKKDVDTSAAGANVIVADGSVNNIKGSYVAKIYNSVELSEDGTEVVDSKKLHKYDAAFYSKKTMNIDGGEKGDGILNITAENEGLDSELHLTINGGVINITSGNDGINTNEDNVSVTTINGGTLNILCDGSTGEGDGIDSNGWLVINGGFVTAQACATSGDAGIDADMGIYIDGGKVIASGNMFDRIAGGEQTYAVFSFVERQQGEEKYTLKNSDDETVTEISPENEFTYIVYSADNLAEGDYTFLKGEIQLRASVSVGAGPGNMQPPSMDEEMSFPDGTRPVRPEDGMPEMQKPSRPDGEIPTMPEGESPMNQHPVNGFDGEMPAAELSEVFTIKKGENYFSNIR